MALDFETGKQRRVARFSALPGHRRRSVAVEYGLLLAAIAISISPYGILFWFQPLLTSVLVPFIALFKVLLTFVASTRTDTSHHIRFLLAGSNPIGMTGGSSLMLGAVDSILDWREDSMSRRKYPSRFFVMTLVKFLLTPIGIVLMMSEFAWDTILLRRSPQIVRHKWNEFFSLARYHNVICPEKSNDIFYADMAFARYRNDPYHYQWVRMRSMVFELQHYKIDVEEGIGAPDTNVFLQSDIAAYQILKRLRLEEIESQIAEHFAHNPNAFVVPRKLTGSLVRNARPLFHYLRMRHHLDGRSDRQSPSFESEFTSLAAELAAIVPKCEVSRDSPFSAWHLQRILDTESPVTASQPCSYLPTVWLQSLAAGCYVQIDSAGHWRPTDRLDDKVTAIVKHHFHEISNRKAAAMLRSRRPDVLRFQCRWFSPDRAPAN